MVNLTVEKSPIYCHWRKWARISRKDVIVNNRVLNILSIAFLVATLAVLISFIVIFNDPNSFLNPFPPPAFPTLNPTPTITSTPFRLPPTWTSAVEEPTNTVVLRPSSTPQPTETEFILPSPTLTWTPTFKPVYTKVRTNTPTEKPQETEKPRNTPTEPPTETPTDTQIPIYPYP